MSDNFIEKQTTADLLSLSLTRNGVQQVIDVLMFS